MNRFEELLMDIDMDLGREDGGVRGREHSLLNAITKASKGSSLRHRSSKNGSDPIGETERVSGLPRPC
jgi:hypothetical protein